MSDQRLCERCKSYGDTRDMQLHAIPAGKDAAVTTRTMWLCGACRNATMSLRLLVGNGRRPHCDRCRATRAEAIVVNADGSAHELTVLCRDCWWPTWREDSTAVVVPSTVANHWREIGVQLLQMESMLTTRASLFARDPDAVKTLREQLQKSARELIEKARRLGESLPADAAAYVRRQLGD